MLLWVFPAKTNKAKLPSNQFKPRMIPIISKQAQFIQFIKALLTAAMRQVEPQNSKTSCCEKLAQTLLYYKINLVQFGLKIRFTPVQTVPARFNKHRREDSGTPRQRWALCSANSFTIVLSILSFNSWQEGESP